MKHLEPTEHEIQTMITHYLRAKGYYVMRLNSGMIPMTDYRGRRRMIMMGERGTPDLLAFKEMRWTVKRMNVLDPIAEVDRLRLLFIEVKRPGKVATPAQEMKMKELEEYGATCMVASDIKDLEEVGI